MSSPVEKKIYRNASVTEASTEKRKQPNFLSRVVLWDIDFDGANRIKTVNQYSSSVTRFMINDLY